MKKMEILKKLRIEKIELVLKAKQSSCYWGCEVIIPINLYQLYEIFKNRFVKNIFYEYLSTIEIYLPHPINISDELKQEINKNRYELVRSYIDKEEFKILIFSFLFNEKDLIKCIVKLEKIVKKIKYYSIWKR
jgi:hypothetical protein